MKKQIIKDPTYNIYSKGGNVDEPMPGRGDGSIKIKLADLEKQEFDVFQNLADQIQEDFKNEKKPGESLIDWLKKKPDSYFQRIELKDGGNVFFISDYLKQKEDIPLKKIDLASYFAPGKTISSLTDAEREVVNKLLRMSLGKKD
jgi:hypothetical protein